MRVCLDCTPFLLRSAGVKAYLFQLHMHMRRTAGDNTFLSFPWLDRADTLIHEGSVLGRVSTLARMGLIYFANIRSNPVLDLLGSRFDVFHASNQVRNPPSNALLTTTVHDMTPWSHPELHTAGNVINDKRFAERIVKRSRGIVTPSESSRRDVIQWLGLPEDRVRAIHHGIADEYFDEISSEPGRARYGLEKPYILFVSTIEPRKNLPRLMDAYEGLRPSLREEFDLVVAGPEGWNSAQTMERLRAAGPSVHQLGYVPEQYLPGLIAGAAVFAYPSLYEGFGFPVAQAMAAGAPVITSNVSSLPEVAGGAALLVDPQSTEELRSALDRVLSSPELRSELSAKGREQAARFRWDRCAREHWQFFESL
jgi:glycosyltransferase involved in cell wall biosynthesis